jgi:hypothetical protein
MYLVFLEEKYYHIKMVNENIILVSTNGLHEVLML